MDHVSLSTQRTWEAELWQTLGVFLQNNEGLTVGISSQFIKTKPVPFKMASMKLLMLESLDFSKY